MPCARFTAEAPPLPRGASAPDGSALLHGQLLAVVNKTDGDRARTYSPLAQPSLVGSTCASFQPVNTDIVCGCCRAYALGVGQVEYPDWVGEMTEEQRGVVLAPYHPGYGNGAGDRRPEPKL